MSGRRSGGHETGGDGWEIIGGLRRGGEGGGRVGAGEEVVVEVWGRGGLNAGGEGVWVKEGVDPEVFHSGQLVYVSLFTGDNFEENFLPSSFSLSKMRDEVLFCNLAPRGGGQDPTAARFVRH